MKPTIILCAVCDEPCGREYPDSGPTYDSGGEPGYREGRGENFEVSGEWYCSAECRDSITEKSA